VPRYFFVLQSSDGEDDDADGTVLPNDAAARKYAERIVRELKEAGGYDDPGLSIKVKKDSDGELFAIPF
jgi:hypothetical protein